MMIYFFPKIPSTHQPDNMETLSNLLSKQMRTTKLMDMQKCNTRKYIRYVQPIKIQPYTLSKKSHSKNKC